jgi:hypothetical protein
MIIAGAIMFLVMASYFVNGIFLLLDLGVFTKGLTGTQLTTTELTVEGELLVLAGFYLFFGVLALAVLVGFLTKRKWAWSAAMTWTSLSLAANLVAYFHGNPRYLTMLGLVTLFLVLNQASVHKEFRLEERR